MGLNEFPPLLGEGLMIKALPGLAAAVGSFVRAYGSWQTAALARFPLAALPLHLAGGFGWESSARGACGCVGAGRGVWAKGGEAQGGVGLAPLLLQETHSLHKISTEPEDRQVSEVTCTASHTWTLLPLNCGPRHSTFPVQHSQFY